MTKRIFRSIFAVSLSVLLAALTLIVGVLHGYFESRTEIDLSRQAAVIAHGVALAGRSYLDGLDTASRVTWVDRDGAVLYDNWERAENMENHAGREEIQEALELGRGAAARYSDTLAQKTIYCAVRLDGGTVVRAADTAYSVWTLVVQALQSVAIVILAALVLAGVLASRVSRQIVKPINELDLSDPNLEDAELYDELTPLLAKLRAQRREIRGQMAQLRRRQEEFSAITENMSEGFLVLDTRARVLSHNSAALTLLRAEGRAAPGETSVYALSREEGFRLCVEEALAGRRSERTLSGPRCRQIIASPVVQDGHLGGAVLVILDVTEREERESLRREFTANVSHELRTPLTSISGAAEILENGLVKPEDVPHFAGNIRRESGRLIGLVNDIIRLSRLDEGDPGGAWETVELYALAGAVLEQVRPAAEKKRVALALRGGPAAVQAVPQILEEMVYSLCDNAVAYNRDGGTVTVDVESGPEGARLTVADTGAGIAPEDRERVFERFYRADKSRSDRGTGLGLSIVKHGAAYLGAAVGLSSEVGTGSAFTLTFPPPGDASEG